MQQNNSTILRAQREELLTELAQLAGLIHGSWVERFSTCSRPTCSCHQGKRHGPRAYVVINEQGRQRPKYIPNSQKAAVQQGITQYKRLLTIADRISHINLILMRDQTLERSPSIPSLGP